MLRHFVLLLLMAGAFCISPNTSFAQPPILAGISGGGNLELGQRVTLQVNHSTGSVGYRYQWRKGGVDIPGATNVTYVIVALTPEDGGTYAAVVSNDAGSSIATTSITVRPAAAPVFVVHPRALVLQVGQAATFSFSATGSYPRTYQWLKDDAAIAGATGETYTIAAINTSHAGVYSVRVSNAQGGVTSLGASLTVNAATPPVIFASSPSDANYTHGETVQFSVSMQAGSSPFTYQWKKNGVDIAGATTANLRFAPVVPADEGRYSVVVSNVAGSATSREAQLTVRAASRVAIQRQPESITIAEGQSASLSVSVSGSFPVTYQWSKNGTIIANATSSGYSISQVKMADAGNYSVTVSNVLGSVTSTDAVLTVTPPVAPTITRQPASQNINFGSSFGISVQASGTPPMRYQWQRNGTPIAGATSESYSVYDAKATDGGAYTVVVTNAAGSVTSNTASITVAAPNPPTISQQPVAVEAAVGLNASFSARQGASGTGSLTYQWLKDGVPIAGANSLDYYITGLRDSHAGMYSIVITGAGGSVTSQAVRLTVLPPAPPGPRSTGNSYYITYGSLGERVSLNFGELSGTQPFSYQWSKDGVVLRGETSSQLVISQLKPSDLGTYTLTVSNEGGVYTTPGMRLRLQVYAFSQPASSAPWLDIAQEGDTVYILATSPSRIERYDLGGDRWLPVVMLSETQVPTAFLPTPEGVFIAYGRTLVRRPLDLSTETPIANVTSNVTHMFSFGSLLYYNASATANSGGYSTLNRSTLQAGPAATLGRSSSAYRQVSIAATLRKGFGRSTGYSPADMEAFTFNADGSIANSGIDSPYHGTMPVGSRSFVFPGDQFVADDAGTVYRTSDLTYAGSLGEPFTDLAFMSDGTPVVLRGGMLTTVRSDSFIETARAAVSSAGLRVFVRGTNAFVFGPGATSGSTSVSKFTSGQFAPQASRPPSPVPSGRYSVDDAFLGADGVVYLLSRSLQALVPWDPGTRSYRALVPLRSVPVLVFHQLGNSRLIIHYGDGSVNELPLRAGAVERTLFNVGHHVRAIVDLGDMISVNISDAQSSGDERFLFTATGPRFINTSLYEANGLAWQAGTRRLYSVPAFSGSTIQAETITTAGALVVGSNGTRSILTAQGTALPPIRFNPEGTLLATANGRVFNAELAEVGVLANNFVDAAWLSSGLFTLRNSGGRSVVQRWSRQTYLQSGFVSLAGTPVRLLRLSDSQMVVVSSMSGFPSLALVDADLTPQVPPDIRQFAGFYFASLETSRKAGGLALQVSDNGTAVLLAYVPTGNGTGAALLSNNVTLNGDGSFVASVSDMAGGPSRTIVGKIEAAGTFSGSLPNLDLAFSGTRSTGQGVAGFYRAFAVNGGSGSAYAMVGPDGTAVVLVQNGSVVEGEKTSTAGSGQFRVSTSTNASLTFAINAASGQMTVTADRDAFANTTFAGLRDDVVRTDRLANISTRGRAGANDESMIAGFVIVGGGPRAVMVRAIGPALNNFGVAGAMADPKLTLFRGGTQVAVSDNWSGESNAAAISQTAGRVGAFALPSPGRDAVVMATLEPGSYTAQIEAATGGGGIALVEVYDAGIETGSDVPKLINISTRGRVGAGEDTLIAGIVVTGNVPKRVLVRAIGPTLGSFGVAGTLPDPLLTILSGSRTIATNDDWTNATSQTAAQEVVAAAVSVGAFALPVSSRDASLVITLNPGNYTAQVSGKGGSGVALVEVYELAPKVE